MSKPTARIGFHAAQNETNSFQFELVDVDGPRRGQRLVDQNVAGVLAAGGTRLCPNPLFEATVRYQLRTYGARNGYTVLDESSAPNGRVERSRSIDETLG